MTSSRVLVLCLLIPVALSVAPRGWAYNFTLSETEFMSWPKFCQVVYLRTIPGQATGWDNRVTAEDIRLAEQSVLGDSTFGGVGVHHYCAGMTLLRRAKLEADERTREGMLRRAEAETSFTLRRAEPGHHLYAQTATQMANILYEQGRYAPAMDLLDEIISHDPMNPAPYTAKAAIYHQQGEFERAREILVAGDERTDGTSPDIQYSLGLVLMKLDRNEEAVEYARKAYAKGYPLPGLMRKLQRAGYWTSGR